MRHEAGRNRTGSDVLGRELLTYARKCLKSCEHCDPLTWVPFRTLLHRILGRHLDPSMHILPGSLLCPSCNMPITEDTLIEYETAEPASMEKVFEPSLEENKIFLVGEKTVCEAEYLIAGCEHCSADPQITLDYVLDLLTECDPAATEYLLCRPVCCPRCHRAVNEKTLVEYHS